MARINFIAHSNTDKRFSPWIEQELPFADGAKTGYDESCQEAIEPKHEAYELKHEHQDLVNPVSPSLTDDPRLVEPAIENPIRLPWEDEPQQMEPEIENSGNLILDDESGFDQ